MALPTRDELRALSPRRDAPALWRSAATVTLFVASAWLAATGSGALRAAAVALCGAALAGFFPMMHEAGHGTAFARRGFNEAATWLGALFMLQVPAFFREFHWEHHRSTQEHARDSEIAAAPGLLDDWPPNPFVYAALASGQPLMAGKAAFTLACALLPTRAWAALFPFVRAERRARVARQSRIGLVVVAGSAAAGLRWADGFAFVLLAWPVAHLLLGLYLMPEHTGLPNTGTQLKRTRSVRSNALVRAWMWNMPFHSEHHLYPGVPFHALPVLHTRVADALVHRSRGYLAFHAEALRRAFGRRAPQDR